MNNFNLIVYILSPPYFISPINKIRASCIKLFFQFHLGTRVILNELYWLFVPF